MTDLVQRIEDTIRNRHLLKRSRGVLIAVSGGLDSMSLLKILHLLSARHHWKLTVAHFNHQLRGGSSDADERLVRKTAASLKLPFVVEHAEVREFAKKSKLSVEMAARKLRHQFFARVAKERKTSRVALAHHADDQVELFFLRALRGAGGEGLAGMKWRSPSPVEGKITLVRPLLDVTKAELAAFARENKVHFHEDATNASLDLPRNRIRHELLSLLRRRYQPALTRTILRLMDIVGAEADFVTETAGQWLKAFGRDGPPGRPRTPQRGVPTFDQLPLAVQRRVLQLQLVELGVATDFDLVERLRRSSDVCISVSPNYFVTRDPAGRVGLQTQSLTGFKADERTLNLAGRAGEAYFSGVRFRWNFVDAKKPVRFGKRTGCEFFNADKVGRRIILRHWRAGDRFQPIGLKSTVKLQDLFTNQKIPRPLRRELIVAEAETGEIFWVQDLRIGEHSKLTPETKRRLVWRWRCHSR